MPLATRADYEAAFGARELLDRCDRDGDGLEDAGVFDAVLADAEAEVQGYVNARPAGMAAPDAALLRRVTLDVLRYLLYRSRMDKDVQEAYDRAVNLLRAIATGRIGPAGGGGTGTGSTGAAPTADDIAHTSHPPVFSKATLGDY